MKNIMKSSVYVGTYGKYNSGSIDGKWLRPSDYTTKYAFTKACKQLHSDEQDPEFMFQDWENIPTSMISESSISDELWHVLNSMKKFAHDRADEFAEWCDDNGAEQDYAALKEFLGFNKEKPKNEQKKNDLQMSREQIGKIINNLISGESRRRYYFEKTSNAAYFGDKVVLFDKPSIETSFCFDDENEYAMSIYHEFCINSKKAHDYFWRKNLNQCDELKDLNFFENGDDFWYKNKKMYLYKPCYDYNYWGVIILSEEDARNNRRMYSEEELIEMTDEQKEQYRKLLLHEKKLFESRLEKYLKRYGVSKCRVWSYWANA